MEKMLHIIPRAVARARGYTRYFTGKPCKNGHLSERRTERKTCIECKREIDRAANATAEKKAARSEYDRKRWIEDHEKMVAKNRRYYAENADAVNAQKRDYYSKNKERLRTCAKEWKSKNRHVVRALLNGRKNHIKVATPPWADREKIKQVYLEAEKLTAETGVVHHVDHVIPLKGDLVCGLHVHENLAPLPWVDNIKKKNKFEPS